MKKKYKYKRTLLIYFLGLPLVIQVHMVCLMCLKIYVYSIRCLRKNLVLSPYLLLLFRQVLVVLRGGRGVHKGDEGAECRDKLEGGHRLAKVVRVDAGEKCHLQDEYTTDLASKG
jgi:hypothetical protein